MAIEFDCEECGKALRVRDELAGKRIKCPGCGAAITVEEGDVRSAPPPPPIPKASKAAAVRPRREDDRPSRRRDEDDEDEAPRRRPRSLMDEADDDDRPAAKRRDRRDPDEDDERPRRRSRDEDDRDDEEEDEGPRRPAKKKGKKSKSGGGNSTLFIILGVGGLAGLLLLGGGVWLILSLMGGGSSNARTYVPANGVGFVTLRMAEMYRTETAKNLIRKAAEQAKGEVAPQNFEQSFGVRLEDIDRLTMVFPDANNQSLTWMIIESNVAIDAAKVKGDFANHREATHEGKKYLVGTRKNAAEVTGAWIVGPRMLIVGPDAGVKQAIDLEVKPRAPGPLDEHLGLLSSGTHVAGAFQVPAALATQIKAGVNNPSTKQFAALAELKSGMFTATVGDALDLELTAVYPGDAQAQAAKGAADKALALATVGIGAFKGGLPAAQQQAFGAVERAIETVKINQSGSKLQMSLRFEGLNNALNMIPGGGGLPGPVPGPGPRPGPPGPGFGGGMPPGPPGPRPR